MESQTSLLIYSIFSLQLFDFCRFSCACDIRGDEIQLYARLDGDLEVCFVALLDLENHDLRKLLIPIRFYPLKQVESIASLLAFHAVQIENVVGLI